MILSNLFLKTRNALAQWFPLENLTIEHIRKKDVPIHGLSWGYFTGGSVLICLLIQIVTGGLLLFYYEPTVSEAHASVEYITQMVPGGAWIRNLHAWGSSAMIFFIILHMLVTFAMKAFTKPREITWILGMGLLVITFGLGFTGYLLPWNQIAVNATKVVFQSIEEVGQYLPGGLAELPRMAREVIQGEASVGQATLSRFYAIHVMVLPFSILGLLGLHVLLVQLHGISEGVDKKAAVRERFFPDFVIKDLMLWAALAGLLFTLAICLPFDSLVDFPLLQPYNPLGATPSGIKPEWYFFFVFYPMEMLPFWVIIIAMTALMGGLLLAPWIFKNTSRKILQILAAIAAVYLAVMTLWGGQIHAWVSGGL